MDIGRRVAQVLALTVPLFLVAGYLWAHCDGLDGPVVKAAQRALETGNVDYALIWAQPGDEPELREAFRQALEVRVENGVIVELRSYIDDLYAVDAFWS